MGWLYLPPSSRSLAVRLVVHFQPHEHVRRIIIAMEVSIFAPSARKTAAVDSCRPKRKHRTSPTEYVCYSQEIRHLTWLGSFWLPECCECGGMTIQSRWFEYHGTQREVTLHGIQTTEVVSPLYNPYIYTFPKLADASQDSTMVSHCAVLTESALPGEAQFVS